MPNDESLSVKELDYLREMINIGSGHAATALSRMLACRMEVDIPNIYLLPAKKVPEVLGRRYLPSVCVKMGMVGDVRGEIFFVIPEAEKARIAQMAEKVALGSARKESFNVSVIEEIGNIMAGAYMRAIHDFCGLNIYHTAPVTAAGPFQALIDELLADMFRRSNTLVVIENEFAIVVESDMAAGANVVRFVFPSPESTRALVDSVKNAMPR